jgi:hypothetical protein
MSPVLNFDIIALIIDIVGENEDTNLLKELALVSHSFLQICTKHLFATINLHDAFPHSHIASSKKGFLKLFKSKPDVFKYIRKLTYKVSHTSPYLPSLDEGTDRLLSPILRTFSCLNCLKINASHSDWNTLDSSLTSAFLHLMHLPTINHIELSNIENFPLPSLSPSVNLHRLDLLFLFPPGEDVSPGIIVQSEMMPKIREFNTSWSTRLTTKLIHSKMQDEQPAFNFVDLRKLSMSFTQVEDEQNVRYFLQNAKLLEELHLSVEGFDWSLVGLHDILSPTERTLKSLDLTLSFLDNSPIPEPHGGLCEELEAMAGHNMLEALSLEFELYHDGIEPEDFENFIGSIFQNVERVLVLPGWSALRYVSFNVSITFWGVPTELRAMLLEELQSLPDIYLDHLPNLESRILEF